MVIQRASFSEATTSFHACRSQTRSECCRSARPATLAVMHPELTALGGLEELDRMLTASSERPLLLFKYSSTCGTSAEALDELEAEELEMLTEDESSETLVVDEAAEMRAIRREELAMARGGADEATEGEFVCSQCFLVLKTSQLADARRNVCNDCAA